MKKFLSLILAALLLLSCTAFAENMNVTVSDKNYNWSNDTEGSDESQAVKTEMWLQVTTTASDDGTINGGQIDVTVPLVLIFQTSIDGGSAATANNYKITNNSTAPLAVTKISKELENTEVMTLKDFDEIVSLGKDEYKVKLSVEEEEFSWDLEDTLADSTASAGGHFGIGIVTEANANGNETIIKAEMETGALTFVTAHDENGDLIESKGLKLLTVSYTVAIDLSEAIGGDTETAGDAYTIPSADVNVGNKPAAQN